MSLARLVASCLLACVVVAGSPAYAYVGPGAGITMLGALWGVVAAVLVAVGAVFYLPIRALLRRRRQRHRDQAVPDERSTAADAEPGKAAS
jgi:hypothetical protein